MQFLAIVFPNIEASIVSNNIPRNSHPVFFLLFCTVLLILSIIKPKYASDFKMFIYISLYNFGITRVI